MTVDAFASATQMLAALDARKVSAVEEWDVLLAPAFYRPAYPHLETPWPATPASFARPPGYE
jgi:hypothetical protein